MYKWENYILEQYPFAVTDTRKGRGAICCMSEGEAYMLKEYRGSEQRAVFLYDVLQYLKGQGINISLLIKNKEDKCVSTDRDGVRYIVVEHRETRECDTRSRREILDGVRQLARLHEAFNRYEGDIPEFIRMGAERDRDTFSKRNREMKSVYTYIYKKRNKNEFEREYIKVYKGFWEQACQVIKAEGYFMSNGTDKMSLCHGEYSQHNVIFDREKIGIAGLEQIRYGRQMNDLGFFMRKILEKQNWNIGLGLDMIKAYNEVRKLDSDELEQLYLFMMYPEKFWKLANHYASSKKSWLSERNIEKLRKIIAQEEKRAEFLDILSTFFCARQSCQKNSVNI